MLANSQAELAILIPAATVVFIIVCVLFFLRRNRERLQREIAKEWGINLLPKLDKLPMPESRRRQQWTTAVPSASEEEVQSPRLPA